MLYYLLTLLQDSGLPGVRLMNYITFRSGAAFVLALLIAIFVGRAIIHRLQKMQIGEIIRDLSLQGQIEKKGTPTMGGIIIIIAILVPCLLVGRLTNAYMLLMLLATVWLGTIGFLDDYMKFRRRNKDGIKGKYKIIGQVGIALIVAVTMYLSPSMVIVENREVLSESTMQVEQVVYDNVEVKSPQTTIPFVKNNNFDYSSLTSWAGDYAEAGGWVVFFLITIFLVAATSNGANLNDGMDGMCAGLSAVAGAALAALAYLGIPQYNVRSRQRGACGLHGRFRGSARGFPVVQRLSGGGIHGRHRQPHPRRRNRRVRNPYPQGAAAAHTVRPVLHRGPFGDCAGGIFQTHRRRTNIQDDSPAPPLPETR